MTVSHVEAAPRSENMKYIKQLLQRIGLIKPDDITFDLTRFKEHIESPILSECSIRILSPSKSTEFLITLDDFALPWWDEPIADYNFRLIPYPHGGANARIPKKHSGDYLIKVLVQENGKKRVIKRIKLKDILEMTAQGTKLGTPLPRA